MKVTFLDLLLRGQYDPSLVSVMPHAAGKIPSNDIPVCLCGYEWVWVVHFSKVLYLKLCAGFANSLTQISIIH